MCVTFVHHPLMVAVSAHRCIVHSRMGVECVRLQRRRTAQHRTDSWTHMLVSCCDTIQRVQQLLSPARLFAAVRSLHALSAALHQTLHTTRSSSPHCTSICLPCASLYTTYLSCHSKAANPTNQAPQRTPSDNDRNSSDISASVSCHPITSNHISSTRCAGTIRLVRHHS